MCHLIRLITCGSILVIICAVKESSATTNQELPCFQDIVDNHPLCNVVYDHKTSNIYVAAVDRIYQLSSDLQTFNTQQSGPVCGTSPELCQPCNSTFRNCSQSGEPVSNFNQLLLLDSAQRKLIACGNQYNGSCERFELNNLLPVQPVKAPVVPTNISRSVVGFVGSDSVIYVGASFLSSNQDVDIIPLISARDSNSLEPTAAVINVIPSFYRTTSVKFITAFQHGLYIYFFVQRRTSPSDLWLSYILRICRDHPTKVSLVELPVKCIRQKTSFPYLRDAVFAPYNRNGVDMDAIYTVFAADSSHVESPNSAVCIYLIEEVDRAFQAAIRSCFNGSSSKGPSYIADDTSLCIKMGLDIGSDFCAGVELNSPIAGTDFAYPNETFVLKGKSASSVAAGVINNVTMLFIGTNNGELLKLVIGSSEDNWHLGSLEVPERSSQAVKEIVVGGADSLYLLTDKHLCRVPAYDCSRAHSCEHCVKDPHCGWCMTNRRCTHKNSCSPSGTLNTWLNQMEECPNVNGIDPSMLPVNLFRKTSVSITVRHIPESVPQVACLIKGEHNYSSGPVVASFNQTEKGLWKIVCSPLLQAPVLSNSMFVNLTLVVSFNGLVWFETGLMVFDCSHLNRCTSCLESEFPCTWCVQNNLCRHSSMFGDCSADSNEFLNQSSMCPRVEPLNGNASLLVVGLGQFKDFHFAVFNILPFHKDNNLKCRFESGGQFLSTNASLSPQPDQFLRHDLSCGPVKLEYAGAGGVGFVQFQLIWGADSKFVIDSPSPIQIEIFKCELKASNCGHCLLLHEAYQCVWCRDTCSHENHCDHPDFVYRNAICPNPKITSFSPQGGPVGGRTVLTISGINLGKNASDLKIQVAGIECPVLNDGYKATERVMCRTREVDSIRNGTISLSVRTIINATESEDVYSYKNPDITHFSPRKGPLSGGTRVTAVGTNLDYGSFFEVFVGTSSAKIVWRNGTHLAFIIPPVTSQRSTMFKLEVDGNNVWHRPDAYVYNEDPKVSSINPSVALLSGGNTLDVRGSNLNTIAQPQFIVYVRDRNFTTKCRTPASISFMHCPTPDLRHVAFASDEKLEFDYGFIMDDVQELLKVQEGNPEMKKIQYKANPEIFRFASPVAYRPNTQLKIYGRNLNIFQDFTDVSVSVNGLKCLTLVFTATTMSCDPPGPPVKSDDLNEEGDALVNVTLGNFAFEVGYLSYYDHRLSTAHVIGIACVVAVLLGVGLILFIVCILRMRRSQSRSLLFGHRLIDGSRKDRVSNSYAKTEMQPLQDRSREVEDQADEYPGQDDGHFIQALLQKIENPRRRSAAREILVSRDRLEMGNIIGKGNFSCVYLATLKDSSMRNPLQVVAKTIEGPEFEEKMLEKILRESVVMRNFNHPRLVSLTGLCLSSRTNPIVILPFMANGNLRTYIKDKSKNFTARQLLMMSQQVAEGMSYLSSRDLVHRNLAARNCLLDEQLEVKVSDFVLSHEQFEQRLQYGTQDDWAKLPIKWMAPETMETFFFTAASDVWSFGVLMWELMTRGVTPYSDIPLKDMKDFLNTGQRLKKPKYCPETVYRIMIDCWQRVAERRPTFPDLVNRLEVLLNPPRKRQSNSFALDEEPLYVNTTDLSSPTYLRSTAPSPIA